MTRDAAGMTLRSVTKRKRGDQRQKCQVDRRPGANGRVSRRSSRTANTDGGDSGDDDSCSEGTGTCDDDTDSDEEEDSTAPAKRTQPRTTQLAKSATAAAAASACKRQRTSNGAQSLGLWHEYDPALRFEARRLHDDKESAVEVAKRMCAAGHGKAKVDNRGRKPFNGRQRLVCTTAYGRCPWLCEVQPIHDDDGYGRKVTSWRCVLVKGVHDHEPQRVSRGIQTEPDSPILAERGIQAAQIVSVPSREVVQPAVQPQLQHAARLDTPGETTITDSSKESAQSPLDSSSKGQEKPHLATVSPDNSESELSDCSGSDSDSVDSGGKTNDDDYASCSSQQTEVPANFGHMKSDDIPAGAGKKDRARYMLWIQVQALVSAQNPRNPAQAAVRIFNREWEDVKADLTTSRDAQPHENAPTAVAEANDVPNQTILEKESVTKGPFVDPAQSVEKRHIGTQPHSQPNGKSSCAQHRPLSTRAPASVQQNRISPVRPSPPLSSATDQSRQPSVPCNDNAVSLPPSRGGISAGQTPTPEPPDAQRASIERKKRPVSVRQSLRLPLIPPAASFSPPLPSSSKAEPTPPSAFDAWANSNCLAFTAPRRSAHNVQTISMSPLQAPQATERHAQNIPSAQSTLSAHAGSPSVARKETANATSDTPVRSKFSAPEIVNAPAAETGAAHGTATHTKAANVAPEMPIEAGSQAPLSVLPTAQATAIPSQISPVSPGPQRSASPTTRTTETVAAPPSPIIGAAASGSIRLGSEKETLAQENSRGMKSSQSPAQKTVTVLEPVHFVSGTTDDSGSQPSPSVRQEAPIVERSLKSPSKSTATAVASPSKHESGASRSAKEGAALQKWFTSPDKSKDRHSGAFGAASQPAVLQDTAEGFNLSRSQSAIHQPMHWTQRSAILQIRSSPGPCTPPNSLDVSRRKQGTVDSSNELAVVIKPSPSQRRTMSSPTPGARPRPRPTPYCKAIAKRTGKDTPTTACLSQPTPASNATPSQHTAKSEIQPAAPSGAFESPSQSKPLPSTKIASVKPSQSRSATTASSFNAGNGSFDAPFVLSDEDD